MMNTISCAAACAALLVCACAGYAAPNEHLANSLASIRTAQELGATASPQAALHLKLAQEEQARAKALVDDGKNEEADFMTMRANSDAELAVAIARQSAADSRAATAAAQARTAVQDANATASAPTSYSATTTTTTTGATVPSTGVSK